MHTGVSALVRSYNSGKTLKACLASLCAQTLPPECIIVVDSGSTDATLDIARAFDAQIVCYPPEEEFSYSRALNVGMEEISTPNTLIISSHVSLPDPETISVLCDLLHSGKNRCAVSIRGMVSSIADAKPGFVEWSCVTKDNFVSRYEGIGISNSCNLIPTKLWRDHPFDEEIPRAEDQQCLVYYLERGWNAARIMRPQIVYDNPYYNDNKEISDILTLAKYDINPKLKEWASIRGRIRQSLSAVKRRSVGEATYNAKVALGLICVRFGFDFDLTSKYF